MPHHIAYLIGRERIAELEHAAGQQRLARAANPQRPRPTHHRLINHLTGRLAALASVI